ncbi:MAG: hypothetical protein HY391_05955 [Deltaproteobacteria bacterium]|nr:hypothetical protein [Deltaproteobacteria bacterium]
MDRIKTKRTHFFILPGFQLRVALFLLISIALSALLIGVVLGGVLWYHYAFLIQQGIVSQEELREIFSESGKWLLWTVLIGSSLSGSAIFLLSIFVSHRIAGPVFALQRRFESLAAGAYQPLFQLRPTDALQDLKDEFNFLMQKYRSFIAERVALLTEAEDLLLRISQSKPEFAEALTGLLAEIRRAADDERILLQERNAALPKE